MLGVASKSFVHVNLHAHNMHKSYMHISPLSEVGMAQKCVQYLRTCGLRGNKNPV
jgi:hypothetical protein